MSGLKRVFSALLVFTAGLVGLGAVAPPAGASVEPAYCTIPSLAGHVSYSAPVTATPSANTFVLTVACNAFPTGHNAGAYSLTLNGTTPLDTCVAGANVTGSGSVTGSGPHGAISGSFRFTRFGIHYYITGTYTSGSRAHHLNLWLDIVQPSPSPCGYTQANIIGHGTFSDERLRGPAIGAVVGSGTVSPGLLLPPATPQAYSLTFSGTATGSFNGWPGTCSVTFSGSGTGTLAASSGSGLGTCGGTDTLGAPINISCSLNFTVALLMFVVTGTCVGTTPGTFQGVFPFEPNSVQPMTSFTAEGQFSIV